MLKMVDWTGIIGVDMICPLGVSTPQPPNYDRVELEGTGMLVLPNSLNAPLERLELGGKTEQVQTTGAQLFDIAKCPLEHNGISFKIPKSSGDVVLMDGYVFEENTQYTISAQKTTSENENSAVFKFEYVDGSRNEIKVKDIAKKSLTSMSGKTVKRFLVVNPFGAVDEVFNFQFEKGVTATPYEPCTGGKPSPSPEYPQEIKSVGKWNEGKQKYEVDVKVTGKNLFNREKAKDVSNWISIEGDGYLKFPIRAKKGSMITFSYEEKLTEGKKFYLGIAKKETGSVIAWLYHDVNLSVSNSKYTIVSEEGYVYLMCNKNAIQNFLDAIQTLQVEISQTQTEYEPYKEQTLTITSDRPITKWDRLIEQGGEIGWLYSTKKYTVTGNENYAFGDSQYYSGISTNMYINAVKNMSGEGVCRRLKSIIGIWDKSNNTKDGFCINSGNQIHMRFFNNLLGVSDDATMEEKKAAYIAYLKKEYEKGTPYEIVYQSLEPEFVPLPQSEQNAIQALKTYYPTTVITADGGGLDPDIKVTYRKEI